MEYPVKKWADVVHIISGKNQKEVASPNGIYPIYGSGGIIGQANEYLCEAGTTIVGRKGTINRPIFVNERFWNVDTAFGIAPGKALLPKYLFYFCQSYNFNALDKSTTIPSLAKRDLLNIKMPIPSISEQKRIVARIEELFSQLDASVKELKTAKERLTVYRQAVISMAYPVLTDENTGTLSDIAEISGGITKGRKLENSETVSLPYLRVANVQNGYLNLTEIKKIQLKKTEIEKYLLKFGDVLYTEGGDRDKLGRGTIWRNEIENCVHQNHIFKARVDAERALPLYISYWSMGTSARNYFYAKGKQSVNLASINKTVLSMLPIPLVSLERQKQVVTEIEAKMSICDSIEKTVDTALQQAEALRQSILKKAFEGRL